VGVPPATRWTFSAWSFSSIAEVSLSAVAP
jgi:hypothetical protein